MLKNPDELCVSDINMEMIFHRESEQIVMEISWTLNESIIHYTPLLPL